MGAGSATHPTGPRPGEHQAPSHPPRRRIRWLQTVLTGVLALLMLLPAGCSRLANVRTTETPAPLLSPRGPSGRLQEVAPPVAVQQLQTALAEHNPQVTILAPRDGANVPSGPVPLLLQVRDWPLVNAGSLGLGPHVVVQVDDQEPVRLSQPAAAASQDGLQIELPALSPGSHRITAYAARPWGEAVKSPGAWDQIRVHRVAANPLAIPRAGTPQLIPVSPSELAGRQPVLLDWLLLDAPLQGLRDNDGSWRLRVTVNGDSFLVDQNAPLWLKGWQTGSNSVLLELVDGSGEPLNPPFNSVVCELVLEAAGPGPIWQRGRLSADEIAQLLGNATPPPPAKAEPTALPAAEPTTEPPGLEPTNTDPQPSAGTEAEAESQANADVTPGAHLEPEPVVPPPPEPPGPALTTAPSIPAIPAAAAPETALETVPERAPEPKQMPELIPEAEPEAQQIPPQTPRKPAGSLRIAPSTSVEGSARNQVNPDGSLLQPKPEGPLSRLRQKLGA